MTRDGVYMSTNRSWSIDDKRLNFQFGCEVGWEVKDGKLGRPVRNPTYTGITPQFWGSMDMLAGGAEWVHWGTPNCGKGQHDAGGTHRTLCGAGTLQGCENGGQGMRSVSQTRRRSPESRRGSGRGRGPRHRWALGADSFCQLVHPSECGRGEHHGERASSGERQGGVGVDDKPHGRGPGPRGRRHRRSGRAEADRRGVARRRCRCRGPRYSSLR